MSESNAPPTSKNEDKSHNPFGLLMRFWRNTFGYSQAQLAAMLETTPRHVSFLETGRSQPTRDMVQRLTMAFELDERETGIMLIAAGFVHEPETINLTEKRYNYLRHRLSLLLAKHDPYPALVVNHVGDFVLFNRSWYSQSKEEFSYVEDNEHPANIYNLYFSHEGLRQRMKDWQHMACVILLKIQEKALLTGDPVLNDLLTWLQAYQGIPDDWVQRARDAGPSGGSSYDIEFSHADGGSSAVRAVVTGIEPERNELLSQLHMHSFFPLDEATAKRWQNGLDKTIDHPLLCDDDNSLAN